MKKIAIKLVVFLAVFLVTLGIAGKWMNQGHDNMTMEMAQPTLPVLMMEWDGAMYNELHGYLVAMDVSSMREVVTVLGENREFSLHGNTYGRDVTDMSLELRSLDGMRLVEDTPVTGFQMRNSQVDADLSLKDLIEQNTEYVLKLKLTLDGEQEVFYYTRVIWSDSLHMDEKFAFVRDFHERLYDREAARELTKYLETNAQLEDNSSFHYVNIHSSFRQLTWGDLSVREWDEPMVSLTEIGEQTASFLIRYTVTTGDVSEQIYYRVMEHFRVRYTVDRMYLLNYERTMTQIPNVEKMYANDKILLGIIGTDIPLVESEDGSNVVFVVDGALYSYNADTNKLAVIFHFYDKDHMDPRTMYGSHSIKILSVDEGGNVSFAVYGYMNRGRHEGEVGIQIYTYSSAMNTIEENIYIPYTKSYMILEPQMKLLLCLNREQILYLMLEDVVYSINLEERTYYPMVATAQSDTIQISENNWIMVWQEGDDSYHSRQLHVRNLNTGAQQEIKTDYGEAILPLGFMGEDIIYGIAREEDIHRDNSGRILFPMYKVLISDSDGDVLKEYRQENIYVTDCTIEDNQITLTRVKKLANGEYVDTTPDQIMNSVEAIEGKYRIVAPSIETYERYVQIQTRHNIDSRTIQILTPKEILFEGGRELTLDTDSSVTRYYVYGAYGVEGTFLSPAKAVTLANSISGVVTDQRGRRIWWKGNRALRNQIMAIKEAEVTEEKNSLALCLDTMLQYEGIVRNSEYLLAQGQTVLEILQDNLESDLLLDLAGCDLDVMLYYVNQDIPVLGLLNDGEAVLITGYNEFNVVILDPKAGTLSKMGMNDAADWFKKNGNNFVTYVRGNL